MRRLHLASIALGGLVLAAASFAEARELKFKEFAFELREGDRLTVAGVKGSVRLIPVNRPLAPASADQSKNSSGGPTNAIARVRKVISDKASSKAQEAFDQWTYTVRRDENVVRIEAKGPDAKTDWESQLKTGFPELHFEIEAPSVPAEVALREGTVQVQNWKSGLVVQLVEGSVRLAKNEGLVRVQNQRGDIRIDGHKGRMEVDGFNPKIQVSSVEGDLNLDNFAGDSAVQTLKGNLQLKAFSGQTVANQVDGGCDFELGRGSLNLNGLDGSLRGQLDNGSVNAKLAGSDPEVNIESQEGSVTLNLPGGSGATVRLQTEEGNLTAPASLPTSKSTTQKFVTGRLSGSGKGSIFVKTKTGNVRLM